MVKKEEHNPHKTEENPCHGCTKCCEYIALEIDKPEDKNDFGQIRWFLTHKDVWVFIDHDKSWNLQFNTVCEKIGEGGWCEIYDKRPGICKGYTSDNCDKNGTGDSFTNIWTNLEDFDGWLKEKYPEFL